MSNIFTDLLAENRGNDAGAEFFLATVASVDLSAGVTIIPDGDTAATTKKYKILTSGNSLLAAGDRVVVMRHSGTCIVLGKIGTPGDLADFVKKTGDTMTGNLTMDDRSVFAQSDELKDGTVASRSGAGRARFYLTDKDGYNLGYLAPYFNANGGQATLLVARRHVGDSDVANSLYLYIAPDGTRSVVVSDAAAWRAAIAAVNKAGDTMTGNLQIKKATPAAFILQSTTADITATSIESRTYLISIDKNGRYLGWIQWDEYTSGTSQTHWATRRMVNGAAVDNRIDLAVQANGTKVVVLSAPEAWRSALGLGTSGSLPITVGQGGTGAVGVSLDNVVSNVITAASGYTFSAADYAQWGKVAQLHIILAADSADSSNAWRTVGTLKSTFRRPIVTVVSQGLNDKSYALKTDGSILMTGPVSTTAPYEVTFTYLLN